MDAILARHRFRRISHTVRVFSVLLACSPPIHAAQRDVPITPEVQARVAAGQRVRVIVGLSTDYNPEGRLTANERTQQRRAIAERQARVLTEVGFRSADRVRQLETIPFSQRKSMTLF